MQDIHKSDFFYELPENRIAKYPLVDRSSSKLLVYRDSNIEESNFNQLENYLKPQDLLVFNNAKVIPARLFFKRQTGAMIEVLLLEPLQPSSYEQVFKSKTEVQWECMIGNLKKWKENETLEFHNHSLKLKAQLLDKEKKIVSFQWDHNIPFIELIEQSGELPLPPYLNRQAEKLDQDHYQTVYAKINGSVAAPTAGLHFDPPMLDKLAKQGLKTCDITLHVGAGTFLPLKEESVLMHNMHREQFELSTVMLDKLIENQSRIAVGTTSLRVLESLYWIGQNVEEYAHGRSLSKLEPYAKESNVPYIDSLKNIRDYMKEYGLDTFYGSTEIMILPHYQIRSVKALITNFHLPESTLLLLVSAVVGEHWKSIYNYAIDKDFRFLSYGDSSLLFLE